jgi:hypothetical protein
MLAVAIECHDGLRAKLNRSPEAKRHYTPFAEVRIAAHCDQGQVRDGLQRSIRRGIVDYDDQARLGQAGRCDGPQGAGFIAGGNDHSDIVGVQLGSGTPPLAAKGQFVLWDCYLHDVISRHSGDTDTVAVLAAARQDNSGNDLAAGFPLCNDSSSGSSTTATRAH